MAVRAYWKGYLKLSLVTCPVALYPASSKSQKTRFHQISKKTGHRLRQQMVDEETGRAVEPEDKGRGYELTKGKYVEVEPEEIEAIEFENTHVIDIDKFVPQEEIDKRYYERPYYIVPDGKSGEEAFAVIRDAMKDKGRVALAGIVFANRQHILAIEPWGKGLLGTTLRYDYEVRAEKEFFKGIASHRVPKEMVSLASHILDTKARAFRSGQVQGRIRAGLAQARKAQGGRQDDRGAGREGVPFERHRSHGGPAAERQRQGVESSGAADRHQQPQDRKAETAREAPQAQGGLTRALAGNRDRHGGGLCTTASYLPQLRKCWRTGETGDLSLRMLLLQAWRCGWFTAHSAAMPSS
jgi:Ku protein